MNLKPEGYNWQDDKENNLIDFQMPKWLEIKFSDSHYSYRLLVDLTPFVDDLNGNVVFGDRALVNMYLTIVSNS